MNLPILQKVSAQILAKETFAPSSKNASNCGCSTDIYNTLTQLLIYS